jgi:esterase/lipase
MEILIISIIVLGLYLTASLFVRAQVKKRLYRFDRSYYLDPLPQTVFQREFFKLPDGTTIDTVYTQGKKTRKVILFLHGNSGRPPYVLHELSKIHNVYSPAFPQFHYSGGKANQETVFQTAHQAYQELLSKGFQEKQILIVGHSFGSAAATYLASQKPNAGKLIIINGFASVMSMCQESLGPLCIMCKTLYFSTGYAQKVTIPVLVTHLKGDNTVPISQGKKLFESFSTNQKEFVELKRESHAYVDLTQLKQHFK